MFLTARNNQKVYVNNFQMEAAITQWNNFLKFSLLSKFLGLEIISETLFYPYLEASLLSFYKKYVEWC